MPKFKVITSALSVRDYPSKDANKVDIIYKNSIIESKNIQGKWVYHNKGWSIIEDEAGVYLENINPIQTRANIIGTDLTTPSLPVTITEDEEEEYSLDTSNPLQYGGASTAGYFIKDVRGIHGMPYQFMETVDARVDTGYTFGRKYTEKIIARLPLLLLTPGKPKFMKGFSSNSKKNILTYVTKKGFTGTISDLIEDSGSGKLYSFETCYKDYYSFVNPMCQRMARYLNIQDEELDGTKLSSFSWENYTNDAFRHFISSKENIAFYIDSDTQISESFSNDTGESMLSSPVNQLSDMGKEIQFLMGGVAGITLDKLSDDSAFEDFNKWKEKYSGIFPKRLLANLQQGFQSVVCGGKMVFPQIWNDSSFSRSYRISIKLRTPDADNLSWFMNIGVPMIHLICLVAPHQLGANGYQSPFLIRGWYKGFFNCDMGIITDMDISKGDKGKWTLDGLPTEVDITFTLKDLYQILFITSDKKISDLLANTALLDYIANMCGINVSKPDLERAIDLLFMTFENRAKEILTFDGFLGVENALSNMVNSIFKKF